MNVLQSGGDVKQELVHHIASISQSLSSGLRRVLKALCGSFTFAIVIIAHDEFLIKPFPLFAPL